MIANYPEVLISDNLKLKKKENPDLPPFIGCFIADKDGRNLLTFEIFHGALELYLKKPDEELFDLEFITMFLSAFERFSDQLNFQNMSGLNLTGNHLKMHSFFCFDQYTITFFVNPSINMDLFENLIKSYFKNFFEVNKEFFEDYNKRGSLTAITHLEPKGNRWLIELNKAL